jgi:O-antigen ligase
VKALELFLIFLTILSPFFYGSVEKIPLFVIEVVALFIFLFLLFLTKKYNQKLIYPAKINLFIIFLSITFLQIIYFPVFFLKIISPNTYLLKQQYGGYFTNFSQLSFYSIVTLEELVKFVSFFLIFICVLNIFTTKKQFERMLLILIFIGLSLALYGVVKKYFVLQRQSSYSFSTFGNKNHFAAYMIMISNVSVAYALYCKNKYKKIIFSFIAAIICASVFLSLSRGGSISLIIALIMMSCLLAKEKVQTNQHWIIMGVIIFALVLVSISGFGPLSNRMSFVWNSLMDRWTIVADAFTIFKNFPIFGVGLGNFSDIFTLYQRSKFVAYYDYLHNDYLQFLFEAGLISAVLLLVFFFSLFKAILNETSNRHDPFVKNIVIGGFCGIAGTVIHSFIDFNFHIPAVTFLFWLLLGLIYKCAYTHFHSGNPADEK